MVWNKSDLVCVVMMDLDFGADRGWDCWSYGRRFWRWQVVGLCLVRRRW